MKISLPTSPKFLREKLGFVRFRLLGQKTAVLLPQIPVSSKKRPISSKLITLVLFIVSILTILVGVVVFAPDLYFRFLADRSDDRVAIAPEARPVSTPAPEIKQHQPEFNPTLPLGNWLVIPRIGVRSEMLATPTADEALAEGIWWVPDFGKPGDDLPIILVAHRYGYKWWWKTDYWKYNSFYLLPELEVGDSIEVIVDQRKWVYQIYRAEEGEQIGDYDADLILYTCKFLNSPIKHFRYARLVDATANSQSQ